MVSFTANRFTLDCLYALFEQRLCLQTGPGLRIVQSSAIARPLSPMGSFKVLDFVEDMGKEGGVQWRKVLIEVHSDLGARTRVRPR